MPDTYRAAVWTDINKIEVMERPMPCPRPGQVVVRIRSAGICGTDLHILAGKHPKAKPPLVPGHEFAGQVTDVGEGVDRKLSGARVGCDSYVGCGKCKYCVTKQRQLCGKGTCELGINIDGGWAEYVVVPAENLYLLPEKVSFLEGGAGCILNCPLAAIETIKVGFGDVVLILGDGPSSLIMTQLAILKGASKVIVSGHRERRLALALELGATRVVNTHTEDLIKSIRSLPREPDVVIDAVGKSKTLTTALKLTGRYGRIHLFGLPDGLLNDLPMDEFLWKELTLKSSTGNPALWPTAMDLISRGLLKVKPLITQQFAISQAAEAIDFVRNRPQEVVKAVFKMPQEAEG